AGRVFTPEDDRIPGGHPIALISYRYWQSQFSGAKDVVNRTFDLNGTVYTVVGILPPRFTGDEVVTPEAVWIPIAMQSQVMPERPGLLTNPNPPWTRIVARLKPATSYAQAAQAVQAAYRRTAGDHVNVTPQMFE